LEAESNKLTHVPIGINNIDLSVASIYLKENPFNSAAKEELSILQESTKILEY